MYKTVLHRNGLASPVGDNCDAPVLRVQIGGKPQGIPHRADDIHGIADKSGSPIADLGHFPAVFAGLKLRRAAVSTDPDRFLVPFHRVDSPLGNVGRAIFTAAAEFVYSRQSVLMSDPHTSVGGLQHPGGIDHFHSVHRLHYLPCDRVIQPDTVVSADPHPLFVKADGGDFFSLLQDLKGSNPETVIFFLSPVGETYAEHRHGCDKQAVAQNL